MARMTRLLCIAAMFIPVMLAALGSPARADTAESLLDRSRAAEQLGHTQEAVRLAQAAIVADPTKAATYSALADLYHRAGQEDFARFYYAEALAIDPQERSAIAGMARAESTNSHGTAAADRSLDNPAPGQ